MSPVSPVLKSSLVEETLIAKEQREYLTIPSVISSDRKMVTARWRLSWMERLRVLLSGDLYLQVLTFGLPLQPLKMLTEEPSLSDCGRAELGGQEPAHF